MIILLCCILLTIADAAVGVLLKLVFGIPFRKAFAWGLLWLLVPPLAIGYGALIERNCFRIKEVSISFENLPEWFNGYRIVHISDIHARSFIGRENKMGWELLIDQNRIISKGTDSIAVIGVQNISASRHFPSKGDLKKASEGTEGMFRIVLSHDPMHWENEILGQDYPITLTRRAENS